MQLMESDRIRHLGTRPAPLVAIDYEGSTMPYLVMASPREINKVLFDLLSHTCGVVYVFGFSTLDELADYLCVNDLISDEVDLEELGPTSLAKRRYDTMLGQILVKGTAAFTFIPLERDYCAKHNIPF